MQVGGELMDFIIVLHGQEAVNTFSSRMHFSLGAGLSVAAGPVGRVLEADMRAGNKGSGVCYTYSCSKGNGYVQFIFSGNSCHVKSSSVRGYGCSSHAVDCYERKQTCNEVRKKLKENSINIGVL
jgi:lipid-binding SYLF domain-containing protein